MTSYLFIVNPHARNGKIGNKWPKVEKEIQIRKLDYVVKQTKAPKHAIEIAETFADDFDVTVAVGGDGTVNEVINGIYGKPTKFGVMPLGNGNDYARLLGLGDDYLYNLDVLEVNNSISLNVGLAKGDKTHYFVNIAEAGITSIIAQAAYTELTWIKGLAKYYLLAMKKILSYNKIPAKIYIDNKLELETNLILCAVGLGYRFGGGFNVLPGNRPFYSDFEICVAGNVPKWKWYWMINKVKNGTHGDIKDVHFYRGKNVKIIVETSLPVEAEGEVFSLHSNSVTFSLAPQKLDVIAPNPFINEAKTSQK